jgi:hypothetical protein
MTRKEKGIAWLQQCTADYCLQESGRPKVVEDLDEIGKLGLGFSSVDELQEVNLGEQGVSRPMYMKARLDEERKDKMCSLLWEFSDCFAWAYTEMSGLNRELVEHTLPIKRGFRPHKQPARNFNSELLGRIKEEVERLLKAGFIITCRYADWVSNIVHVEKKGSEKIRIYVDFRSLNRATPKDEYPMPHADDLINTAAGNKVISFLDGNAGYNHIFMAEEDVAKTISVVQVL